MSKLIKIVLSIPVECNEKLESWAEEISNRRGYNYPKKAVAADLLVDAIKRASNPHATESGEKAEVDVISMSLPPSFGRRKVSASGVKKNRLAGLLVAA